MTILIKGGKILDPGRLEGAYDILIEKGLIREIIPTGTNTVSGESHQNVIIIDATGKLVVPGLIDMHVHLREPGQEHKDTIASGCMAAAAGGFSAVCAMPNTDPANDSAETTHYILKKANQSATARVYPVAGITKGLAGENLCDFGELKAAGAVALSDDGYEVMNSRKMRQALESAGALDLLVITHSEDMPLAAGGVMNEGALSKQMGVVGIPNAAEAIMVMRDIALCELTGARVHIAHVSTHESVRAVREAKKRGARITAETAPHYFSLTQDAVRRHGANAKMNPPLRTAEDVEAIIGALADGTIDVIATDHAPHAVDEKGVGLEKAPNGIVGLETSLPLSLQLVEKGYLSLPELICKMSLNPARILGLENGLMAGASADITIIDTETSHLISADEFQSISRNTPFDGWKLKGRADLTMVGGRIVFDCNAV